MKTWKEARQAKQNKTIPKESKNKEKQRTKNLELTK